MHPTPLLSPDVGMYHTIPRTWNTANQMLDVGVQSSQSVNVSESVSVSLK
jgi:hypothetical protein